MYDVNYKDEELHFLVEFDLISNKHKGHTVA
jgi:hypothetical protein